jgi:hypothetical protein
VHIIELKRELEIGHQSPHDFKNEPVTTLKEGKGTVRVLSKHRAVFDDIYFSV